MGQASPDSPSAGSGRAILLLVLRALLLVPVLLVLAAFGLALRLSAGPMEIGWLAHRLAPHTIDGNTLSFGSTKIAWDGLGHGVDAPLSIEAAAIEIRAPGGTVLDRIGSARVALSLSSLLSGTISVERIAGSDVRLTLRRDQHGFGLDFGRPAATGPANQGPALAWNRLRAVSIADASVSVHDLVLGRDWRITDIAADLHPSSGLAAGRFGATLSLGDQSIKIRGHGAPDADGLGWQLSTDAVVPASLAGLLPQLAPLSAVSLPLTPQLDLHFAHGRTMPVSGRLTLALGDGSIEAAGSSLPIASGRLVARATRADNGSIAATLEQASIALRGPDAPVFTAHASLSLDRLQARRIRASLSVDSDHVGFAGLDRYWPKQAALGARRWITTNITDGTATRLHVESTLAGDQGWSSVAETDRRGGFDATGLVLWWLRPMPPLRDMDAHLTFQGTDAVLIETPHAILPVEAVGPAATKLAGTTASRPLSVSDGAMRITGLDGDPQIGTVRLTLDGGFGDLLVELANPRLNLLSHHPVPFTNPSGHARTRVEVSLPLDNKVSIDAVTISARSTMQHVHLGNIAAGLSLDQADLSVSATADGLSLEGGGRIGGIASTLRYAMDFSAGGPDQITEQAHVDGSLTPSVLSRLGLDPGTALSGAAALDLDYKAHRSGMSRLAVGLDMTGLGIALPVWSKQVGQKAGADATIELDHGKLAEIGPLHADGPDLSVQASARVLPDGTRRLVVRRFLVGRTRGAGEILFPAKGADGHAPIRISAHGQSLDLMPIIDAKPAKPAAEPAPGPKKPAAGTSWIADLSFARVLVGRRTALEHVTAHLENDGARIERAQVTAAGPTPIVLHLAPEAGGRRLTGTVADTGLLLRALDVLDLASGGALTLDAHLDDRTPDAPLTGTVRVGRFVLPDAPLAARIARDLSIYGWLLALPSPKLAIDRLVAPFSLSGDVLTLTDARANAAALGLTVRGDVDLGRQRLDLRGTVVPAWAINQLPGRLPLVGRLFSPEKAGGVIAMILTMTGPFADPKLAAKPLSLLAPGFLRRLLFD